MKKNVSNDHPLLRRSWRAGLDWHVSENGTLRKSDLDRAELGRDCSLAQSELKLSLKHSRTPTDE